MSSDTSAVATQEAPASARQLGSGSIQHSGERALEAARTIRDMYGTKLSANVQVSDVDGRLVAFLPAGDRPAGARASLQDFAVAVGSPDLLSVGGTDTRRYVDATKHSPEKKERVEALVAAKKRERKLVKRVERQLRRENRNARKMWRAENPGKPLPPELDKKEELREGRYKTYQKALREARRAEKRDEG